MAIQYLPFFTSMYFSRATSAWFRRAAVDGAIPDMPSESRSCVIRLTTEKGGKDWVREYMVLVNVNGIIACYRIENLSDGTDRLKWITRIPREIVEEFR